jgi:LytS/YehU family sensor histidine kinase
MLLQPYVENAIKHGVCNLKNKQGIIGIKVSSRPDTLTIEIKDNGVGRRKAMEVKQKQQFTHESKGTELTQRRIDLYHIKLTIKDDIGTDMEPEGTTVVLEIPQLLN